MIKILKKILGALKVCKTFRHPEKVATEKKDTVKV